jgi:hypothetical protein
MKRSEPDSETSWRAFMRQRVETLVLVTPSKFYLNPSNNSMMTKDKIQEIKTDEKKNIETKRKN